MLFLHIRKPLLIFCMAITACAAPFFPASAGAVVFTVASYNVENLFDVEYDRTEYPDYLPGGGSGWDAKMVSLKAANIARVILDLSPDIAALQEIESAAALEILQGHFARNGGAYPYMAVARTGAAAVRCAVLSRFPIIEQTEIALPGDGARHILQVTVVIAEKPLVIFVNHWKSKTGPESRRMACARPLLSALQGLPPHTDYILLGDFNSDYNEYQTLASRPVLNDTKSRTGINHILNTVMDDRLVSESDLVGSGKRLHYNLWLEVEPGRRWSAEFRNTRQSPDSILLPAALYDGKGLSYVDNSFNRFDPGYLFSGGRIYRWQRGAGGRGRHLGKGYSDHLPVYARFTDGPFISGERRSGIRFSAVAAVAAVAAGNFGSGRWFPQAQFSWLREIHPWLRQRFLP